MPAAGAVSFARAKKAQAPPATEVRRERIPPIVKLLLAGAAEGA